MIKYIEDLKIGDVLSENISNVNRSIIVKKEDSVTDRIINILKMWGIKEVNIKSVKTSKIMHNKITSNSPDEHNYGVNKIMDIVLGTSKKIITERINFFEK